jgi:hypothetical protein
MGLAVTRKAASPAATRDAQTTAAAPVADEV